MTLIGEVCAKMRTETRPPSDGAALVPTIVGEIGVPLIVPLNVPDPAVQISGGSAVLNVVLNVDCTGPRSTKQNESRSSRSHVGGAASIASMSPPRRDTNARTSSTAVANPAASPNGSV